MVLASVAGLSFLSVAAWFVVAWRDKRRRRSRLDRAFARGRLVQRTGTGVQGKPYSLYGEIFWSDDNRRTRLSRGLKPPRGIHRFRRGHSSGGMR